MNYIIFGALIGIYLTLMKMHLQYRRIYHFDLSDGRYLTLYGRGLFKPIRFRILQTIDKDEPFKKSFGTMHEAMNCAVDILNKDMRVGVEALLQLLKDFTKEIGGK